MLDTKQSYATLSNFLWRGEFYGKIEGATFGVNPGINSPIYKRE